MNSSSARKRVFVAMIMAIGGCTNSNDSLAPNGAGAKQSTEDQQKADNSNVQLDPSKSQTGVAGAAVEYTVPAAGGAVTVVSKSGVKVAFTVPGSASGKKITFTPTTAAEIGWDDHNFAEVIRMEPDGSKFAEPIVVRPSNKALIVMDFPSGSTKSAPEGLALNAAKDGFLLYHFSTLVVFSPEYDCESQNGWVHVDEAEQAATCTNPAFPVMLKLNCLTHPYCMQIDATCCTTAGSSTCNLESDALSLLYSTADESGEEYAYCLAKEAETEPVSSSVCRQYEVSACDCVGGGSGTHECLKNESGWTDCVCEQVAEETPVDESGAICPHFEDADCTVTDATSCGCATSDEVHTYEVSCAADGGCACKVDGEVTESFNWDAQACMSAEFIRGQWFAHCTQAACP